MGQAAGQRNGKVLGPSMDRGRTLSAATASRGLVRPEHRDLVLPCHEWVTTRGKIRTGKKQSRRASGRIQRPASAGRRRPCRLWLPEGRTFIAVRDRSGVQTPGIRARNDPGRGADERGYSLTWLSRSMARAIWWRCSRSWRGSVVNSVSVGESFSGA